MIVVVCVRAENQWIHKKTCENFDGWRPAGYKNKGGGCGWVAVVYIGGLELERDKLLSLPMVKVKPLSIM